MHKQPEITILFPCLNESKTLPDCINEAKKAFAKNQIEGEILVANNNSSDNSKNIALNMNVKCIDVAKKGYGATIRHALESVNTKYCLISDCDGSYDLSYTYDFLTRLKQGYDLVIGNRFLGKIEKNAMPWTHRYIGTPVISFIGRTLYKNKIGDYNCGLRAFDTKKINELNLKCDGMEFASELIIKASQMKYKTAEIPINFYKDKRDKRSHLNTWSDGFRHLKLLLSK